LFIVLGGHSVSELQGGGRDPQKRLQRQTSQEQRTVARLGVVSDSGIQSVKPSTRAMHQAQERLGSYPVSGQQI